MHLSNKHIEITYCVTVYGPLWQKS